MFQVLVGRFSEGMPRSIYEVLAVPNASRHIGSDNHVAVFGEEGQVQASASATAPAAVLTVVDKVREWVLMLWI